MQKSNFDTIYDQIEKALKLSDRVPSEFKNAVFSSLLEALERDGFDKDYKQIILKCSQGHQKLIDYIHERTPSSYIERTLFMVNYLQNVINIGVVTKEHIEACYEICEISKPKSLTQNIRDLCSKRYDYLYLADSNSYKIGKEGAKFIRRVESDL